MSATDPFGPFVARWRPEIEAALTRALPADAERLSEAMRYAVLGGGKRLRPVACLIGAASVGGDPRAAIPGAVALELIHTYSLVHDDLPCMDDDDLRRGRATVHKAYDDATAVLVGDALLTLAFEVVARDLPAAAAKDAAVALARGAGAAGMVGGQALDLLAERRDVGRDDVLAIDLRKTAALFRAAFEIGAICGGGAPPQRAALAGIGEDLGVAFQIIDDLLDRHSTPEQLGKATKKDAARGKATLPDVLGEDGARAEAERRTKHAIDAAHRLPHAELIDALAGTMLARSR